MDAAVVHQYRFLLALLAGGLVLATLVAFALSRGASRPAEPPRLSADAAARRHLLPHVMLMLVALAVSTGVMLLLPAAMIIRFFYDLRVVAAALACLAVLGAPLVYAWRARPFS